MYLILLGAPGVGKGTQAKVLEGTLGIPQVSTGDMLRAAKASGSSLGQRVAAVMDAGHLVSDGIILDVVRARLQALDAAKGAIFDGFPRTVAQAEALEKIAPISHVVALDVVESEIVARISARYSCGTCGKPFNTLSSPTTRADGRCDACGGEMVQRADDTASAVVTRLKAYADNTAPLVSFYEGRGLLRRVDGWGDPTVITERVLASIGRESRSEPAAVKPG